MKRTMIVVAAVLALTVLLVYFNRGTVLTAVVDSWGLSDPFVGVTADGRVQEGLFAITPSGPSTYGVVEAARDFLAGLDEDQQLAASFAVAQQAPDRLHWQVRAPFMAVEGLSVHVDHRLVALLPHA